MDALGLSVFLRIVSICLTLFWQDPASEESLTWWPCASSWHASQSERSSLRSVWFLASSKQWDSGNLHFFYSFEWVQRDHWNIPVCSYSATTTPHSLLVLEYQKKKCKILWLFTNPQLHRYQEKPAQGQQDGSAGWWLSCQAWWLNQYNRQTESTIVTCHLTSIYMLWYAHVHTCTDTHMINEKKKPASPHMETGMLDWMSGCYHFSKQLVW